MQVRTDFTLKIISEINNKFQGLHNNVIQKGNVGSKYLYALQYNNKLDPHNYVYRGLRGKRPLFRQVFTASGIAGGHTQTFEFANRQDTWFIGTKRNLEGWSTQLARVQIPSRKEYTSNTEFPRLAYLNRAGKGLKVDDQNGQVDDAFTIFASSDLLRFDAAVSPKYDYLMIATVDRKPTAPAKGDNAYFTLYNLAEVNRALDLAGSNGYVNVQTLPTLSSFYIKHITDVNNIGSLQGFDLDNDVNVYISSEFAPAKNGLSKKPRRIVKMPWGKWGQQNKEDWEILDFDHADIDLPGFATELESVQVIAENNLYLTVSYHNELGVTTRSRIYQVEW